MLNENSNSNCFRTACIIYIYPLRWRVDSSKDWYIEFSQNQSYVWIEYSGQSILSEYVQRWSYRYDVEGYVIVFLIRKNDSMYFKLTEGVIYQAKNLTSEFEPLRNGFWAKQKGLNFNSRELLFFFLTYPMKFLSFK